MNRIGQGIAMAGLAISAAWLEVAGAEASGLWLVLVLWIFFADWDYDKPECKCKCADRSDQ